MELKVEQKNPLEECETCEYKDVCKLREMGGEHKVFNESERGIIMFNLMKFINFLRDNVPNESTNDEDLFLRVFDVMKAMAITGERFMDMFETALKRIDGNKGLYNDICNRA